MLPEVSAELVDPRFRVESNASPVGEVLDYETVPELPE